MDEVVLLHILPGASDCDRYHPYYGIRKYQFDGIRILVIYLVMDRTQLQGDFKRVWQDEKEDE